MGITHFSGLDYGTDGLSSNGTLITLTAAEMNTLHNLGLAGTGGFFDHTLTAAEVKACNHVVVPGITGKQFFPTFAAMCATGSVTTATVISLLESTTLGVVMSNTAATMTNLNWVGPTSAGAVITKLNTALGVDEGIIVKDTANNSLTVTTAIRVVVAGYYI